MGKRQSVDLGGSYIPLVADGLQISNPLENMKQGSEEWVGINLGARKGRVSFHMVKLALNPPTKTLSQRKENVGYDLNVKRKEKQGLL